LQGVLLDKYDGLMDGLATINLNNTQFQYYHSISTLKQQMGF